MTIITFERSGKTAEDALNLHLDLNSLPANEAQFLTRLIMEADFYKLPEKPAESSTPDEFHYTITVESGQSAHTIQTSDSTMPEALMPLVNELVTMKMLQ